MNSQRSLAQKNYFSRVKILGLQHLYSQWFRDCAQQRVGWGLRWRHVLGMSLGLWLTATGAIAAPNRFEPQADTPVNDADAYLILDMSLLQQAVLSEPVIGSRPPEWVQTVSQSPDWSRLIHELRWVWILTEPEDLVQEAILVSVWWVKLKTCCPGCECPITPDFV
jgi:hypothetical protein